MSETAEPLAADPGPSAGTLLRQAREAYGLHADTLAANLKVPLRKLEALEEDRLDLLGDAVFVRALASSICRTLKIDPQPVLAKLPQTAQPRLITDSPGINAPFRTPSDGPKPGWLDEISRPVALTVFGLLLAAVVLTFLPQREEGEGTGTRSDPVMPPGTPPVVTAAPAEPRVNDPAAVNSSMSPAASPTLTASTSLSQVNQPAARAPEGQANVNAPMAVSAMAVAPAPAASAPVISANGIVVFRTRGSSWIQVTDAAGNPVFRRQMEAGETAGATGALPLAITIGNTGATEVQVRGKPFNLGPVSRDNVARFEVK